MEPSLATGLPVEVSDTNPEGVPGSSETWDMPASPISLTRPLLRIPLRSCSQLSRRARYPLAS